MAGYDASAWFEFAVAVVGAAAALSGLLFVAMSINIERIVSVSEVPSMAAGSPATLPSLAVAALTTTSGATLLAGAGGGLYWIAPAVTLAFVTGLTGAWVLLVEILR